MRKYLIIALYLLSTGIVKAQIESVTDAPRWFFDPPKNEYAGVSIPLENKELAQQQDLEKEGINDVN